MLVVLHTALRLHQSVFAKRDEAVRAGGKTASRLLERTLQVVVPPSEQGDLLALGYYYLPQRED
jgi:hypothetical protein